MKKDKAYWIQRIEDLCERLQITREELADIMGVYLRGLYFWLDPKSKRQIPAHHARRIQTALEALGDGFCEEAAIRLCLKRSSLGDTVRHLNACPVCKDAVTLLLERDQR